MVIDRSKIDYMAIPGVLDTPVITSEFNTCSRILGMMCQIYNIKLEHLRSKSRKRVYARPRQIYGYLCRTYLVPEVSYVKIGSLLGRDHATVMHYIKETKNLMETDEKYRQEVEMLISKLKLGPI